MPTATKTLQVDISKKQLVQIIKALSQSTKEKFISKLSFDQTLLEFEIVRGSNTLFPCHISMDYMDILLVFLSAKSGYVIHKKQQDRAYAFAYIEGEITIRSGLEFSHNTSPLSFHYSSSNNSREQPTRMNVESTIVPCTNQNTIYKFAKQPQLEEFILPTEENLLSLHKQLHDPRCLKYATCLNVYKQEISLPILGNMGHEYRFLRINRMAVLVEAFDPATHLALLVDDLKEVNTASYFICSAATTFTIIVNDKIIQKNETVIDTSHPVTQKSVEKTKQIEPSPSAATSAVKEEHSNLKLTPSQDSSISSSLPKQEESRSTPTSSEVNTSSPLLKSCLKKPIEKEVKHEESSNPSSNTDKETPPEKHSPTEDVPKPSILVIKKRKFTSQVEEATPSSDNKTKVKIRSHSQALEQQIYSKSASTNKKKRL